MDSILSSKYQTILGIKFRPVFLLNPSEFSVFIIQTYLSVQNVKYYFLLCFFKSIVKLSSSGEISKLIINFHEVKDQFT